MNKDRRATARICIELIKECAEIGEMRDASHEALVEALKTMQAAEYWSLRNQAKHEGSNDSTDAQIAVSRVALPALEDAVRYVQEEDYNAVIDSLELAITTKGAPARTSRKTSRKDLA